MKTTLSNIEQICLMHNSILEMEYDVLYKMPSTMNVETPDGYKPVLGFYKKSGKEAFVKLEDGSVIEGIDKHLLKIPNAINEIKNLKVGDLVSTINGDKIVIELNITDNIIDVYDLSVDSDDHLYVTANGVIHHNTGKTQTVEDTLEELGYSDGNGYFKITGSASPAAVYETLYKNRKEIVFFDDCDGALDSQDGRNLIKAATDTKKVRKVSWMKKGGNYYDPAFEEEPEEPEDGGDEGGSLPRYFDFTGKVVFISNLGMHKLDPDGALKTRGFMIELNPTNMELLDFMQLIYDKVAILEPGNVLPKEKRKEVIEALKPIIAKKAEGTVNLRLLVRALNMAATGLDGWERLLKYA